MPSPHLRQNYKRYRPGDSLTRSAYRDDFFVPVLRQRRHREIAGGGLLDVLAPPGHHRASAFNVVGSVVGAPHFVLVDMCERNLNQFRIPAVFIEGGTRH